MDDNALLNRVASNYIASHGGGAADHVRERLQTAVAMGDILSAEAWRQVAEAVDRILSEVVSPEPHQENCSMARQRAADDFAAIRARMDELRREREQAKRTEPEYNLKAHVRRVPIDEIARATQLRLRRVLG